MFTAIATDDFLFKEASSGVVKSWFEASRPVEFHLYQNGGHGFGLGYPPHHANAGSSLHALMDITAGLPAVAAAEVKC